MDEKRERMTVRSTMYLVHIKAFLLPSTEYGTCELKNLVSIQRPADWIPFGSSSFLSLCPPLRGAAYPYGTRSRGFLWENGTPKESKLENTNYTGYLGTHPHLRVDWPAGLESWMGAEGDRVLDRWERGMVGKEATD